MNKFSPFIQKEFYHILRDTKTLLIVFVMPIVLVILFGFAIRTEIKDASIAVLDNSKDELSVGLTQKLFSSGYFIKDRDLNSNKDIEEVFKEGKIKLAIVIPADFSHDFYKIGSAPIQIIADATNINTATTLINYANSIIEDYRQEKLNLQNVSEPLDITVKMVYNPEMKDVYMFVPGVLALVLLLISAMMTSVSLAKEKENGTLKILTVSPLHTYQIIIGKVVPYLIISLINTAVIIGLSVWIFAIPINGSILNLFLVCLLFLITALSLGILISAISKTQQIAIFLSIIILYLPTIILSGFIYPIENMPLPLQGICQLFPAKWFIEAIKAVMIKGTSISGIWLQLTVLTVMILVFIKLSIVKYSKKG